MKDENIFKDVTICWFCKNSTGNCSWSKNFTPVKNWKAKKTVLIGNRFLKDSYLISDCPEFTYKGKCLSCKYYTDSLNLNKIYYLNCPRYEGNNECTCKYYKKK